MYLVRIGHRHLNMEYLVGAEDATLEPQPGELPPGIIRVTMALGRPFDIDGNDAAKMRRVLTQLSIEPDDAAAQSAPKTRAGRKVSRRSGEDGTTVVPYRE